jgi:hypothetical protein
MIQFQYHYLLALHSKLEGGGTVYQCIRINVRKLEIKLWGWVSPADLVAGEVFASPLRYDDNAGRVTPRKRVAVRAPRHLT